MDATSFRLLYRHLLHLSNKLPNSSTRLDAVQLVKNRFREHRNETCETQLKTLFEEGNSRLGYLKMLTPRSAQRGNFGDGSSKTYYFKGEKIDISGKNKDSKIGTQEKARWSNWTGSNLDPDSVARHQHTLGRAGFKNNSHAKGFF
mmetsp:Transcript_5639/g.7003  ORF Transcript_5639/g.7003 Transcript_5639/m.7003 type:complete len:146 (-) Transcript_5639:227-664(-)